MHIEFRHLRTIQAIHEAGGLARAARRGPSGTARAASPRVLVGANTIQTRQ